MKVRVFGFYLNLSCKLVEGHLPSWVLWICRAVCRMFSSYKCGRGRQNINKLSLLSKLAADIFFCCGLNEEGATGEPQRTSQEHLEMHVFAVRTSAQFSGCFGPWQESLFGIGSLLPTSCFFNLSDLCFFRYLLSLFVSLVVLHLCLSPLQPPFLLSACFYFVFDLILQIKSSDFYFTTTLLNTSVPSVKPIPLMFAPRLAHWWLSP